MALPEQSPPPAAPFSPERGKVAIRDQDGSVWKVAQENLAQAQSEGARLATEAEWASHAEGPVETAGAALVGAARGVTSLSPVSFDTAMVEGGRALGGDASAEDIRHTLNLAKEAHPTASLLGEGGGMVLGAVATGGGGAAVTGESVLARAGQRVVQAAPRAMAEGVGFGLNAQSAEDSLGNHKFAAENYLSAGFRGGAIGVLLGGGAHAGLGAAGDAVGKARGAFSRLGRGAAHEAQEAVEADAVRLTAAPDEPRFGRPNYVEGAPIYGAKTHKVGVNEAGLEEAFAGVPAGESPIRIGVGERLRVSANPDEGMIGSFAHGRETVPNIFQPGKLGRLDEEAPVFFRQRGQGLGPVEEPSLSFAPRREGFVVEDGGGLANVEKVQKPFKISRAKDGPAPQIGTEAVVNPELALEARAAAQLGRETELGERLAERARPKGLIEKAQAYGDEQAYLATGARTGDIRRLGSTPEQMTLERQRLGAVWNREIGGMGPLESRASIGNKIAQREHEVAESLKPLYHTLDTATARPSTAAITERFQSEVRGPAARGLYGTEELGAAEHALANLASKGETPSFSYLHDLRMDLDKRLYTHFNRTFGGPPVPPGEEALRGLRNLVAEELELAAERASKELGTNTAAELKLRNQLYRDLRVGKRTVMAEAARNPAASNFSMSDGQAMGVAASLGHPVGALVPVANVLRKNYGNQLARYALEKATRFEAVIDAGNRIDVALNKGSRAFVAGGSLRGTRPAKTLTAGEVREIRDAVSNPAAVSERVSRALGDLGQYAPKLAVSFSTAAARTAAYLAEHLPKEAAPTNPFFRGRAERPMSDTELRKASIMVETVDDPTIVLDRLRQGRLTRDHVRTLKVTSPETYAKIRSYLTEHAAELRPTMTEQQGVALSILFQTPITASMKPENISAFQASFVGGSQAPKGDAGASQGPTVAQMAAGPIKGGGHRATFFDSFEKATK